MRARSLLPGLLCTCVLALAAAAEEREPDPAPPATSDAAPPDAVSAPGGDAPATPWEAVEILGERVPPGEARRIDFRGRDDLEIYLVALRGVSAGPTLCVTAGVHGDELNGVAIARRLVDETDPGTLRGTLLVAPIVNAYGFRNGSRYLPDRRDLNRYFPGRRSGSVASRIASQLFDDVVRRCDALVDLHTGSLNRTNLAQIRADLREVDNLRIAWGFAAEHVVHSVGRPGTLRRAANDAGIAAVLYEAGEPRRIDAGEIERGTRGVRALLESLGMVIGAEPHPVEQHLYGRTHWVRSDASGIYVPRVALGERVEVGQPLAEITDPFSTDHTRVVAPLAGRVIGLALGQVVIPGFALVHIGLEDRSVSSIDVSAPPEDERTNGDPDDPMRAELLDERPE